MFKAIAIGLMASPLALGGATANRLQPSIKRVAFNDTAYSITLSAEDLSNEYSHLQSYVNEQNYNGSTIAQVSYGQVTPGNLQGNAQTGYNRLVSSFGPYSLSFNLEDGGVWTFTGGSGTPEYDLVLTFTSSNYQGYKDAIELDIQSSEESMPSIADIFQEVTSAITAFVGSLGTAFTQVTSLFYASGEWTFLGVLVLIGVGVGILYGAYRIIKGLLHRV